MRTGELLRLVSINLSQNKFKTVMTSIGIIAGAATIVMVIAIGRGGRMDVAEQFAGLNAGAIDVTYEYEGSEEAAGGSGGFSFGGMMNGFTGMFGGNSSGGRSSTGGRSGPGSSGSAAGSSGNAAGPGRSGTSGNTDGSGQSGGSGNTDGSGRSGASGNAGPDGTSDRNSGSAPSRDGGSSGEDRPGRSEEPDEDRNMDEAQAEEENSSTETETTDLTDGRMNQEKIQLSQADADEIELFVSDITGITISYSVRADVEGAQLTEAQSCTAAGVTEDYFSLGNLSTAEGELFTQGDDDTCGRVCVLGASLAKELFSDTQAAVGEKLYIEERSFTVSGILESSQTVFAGISPDDVIFIPYQTGMKYLAGTDTDTVITVIAQDVDLVSEVEEQVQNVLGSIYPNARFSFSDAGSKMEAAESSNRILTLLLSAMAGIVFLIGGIGIMNVLFVSVKERTGEIGVLKALGASRTVILSEFLAESAAISIIGAVLGILLSFAAEPVLEYYGVRVEPSLEAYAAALGFAVLTGTLFGFYPAWKASRLVPVEALNAE